MKNKLSTLSGLIGAAFVASAALTPVTAAADTSFSANVLPAGYTLADNHPHGEGKPGEGKCGEGKCGEGKCGEGKCGADKKAKGEGKCGEGKCGEGKCGADKKVKEAAPAPATPPAA